MVLIGIGGLLEGPIKFAEQHGVHFEELAKDNAELAFWIIAVLTLWQFEVFGFARRVLASLFLRRNAPAPSRPSQASDEKDIIDLVEVRPGVFAPVPGSKARSSGRGYPVGQR